MTNQDLITEINIYPLKPRCGLVAFASCLYDRSLSLNSIAIYTRPDGSGYRLVYPSKTLQNGRQINLFYPVDRVTGKMMEENIVKAFEDLTRKYRESDENANKIQLRF